MLVPRGLTPDPCWYHQTMDTPLTSNTTPLASGGATQSTPRPCERLCPKCQQWLHHSRYRGRNRKTPHGTVWEFNPICKACEEIERNEKKNSDRPAAIIKSRAAQQAHKAGVSKAFFMVNMNFQSLVPKLRAMMTDEAVCPSCGHPFLNERDIQIEHREAPRHDQDWARLHARNLDFACGSCNRTKHNKSYALWLDEQESARLSNEYSRAEQSLDDSLAPVQLSFD